MFFSLTLINYKLFPFMAHLSKKVQETKDTMLLLGHRPFGSNFITSKPDVLLLSRQGPEGRGKIEPSSRQIPYLLE